MIVTDTDGGGDDAVTFSGAIGGNKLLTRFQLVMQQTMLAVLVRSVALLLRQRLMLVRPQWAVTLLLRHSVVRRPLQH